MKQDFIRTPDGSQRIVEANFKVAQALYIPVFSGDETLNDNPDEAGPIAINQTGQLTYYDGTTWQLTGGLPTGGISSQYLRGDRSWQTLNTDVVTEGSTNKYFTNSRGTLVTFASFTPTPGTPTSGDNLTQLLIKAFGNIGLKEDAITSGTNVQYWRGDKTFQTLNSTVVPEGTNLYYTATRVQTLGDARYVSLSVANAANGYAQLDSSALLPLSLFPDTVLGNVKYKGTYNGTIVSSPDSALNGNALPTAASGNQGYYFIITTATTVSGTSYAVGDWIISDGAAGYTKIENSDAVTTVFGRNGNILAVTGDYTAAQVTNAVDTTASYANPTWITSIAQSKITYTGTTAQYVRGNGSFATFPTAVSAFSNDSGYLTSTSLTPYAQPLENQRLSTTNTPTFSGLNSTATAIFTFNTSSITPNFPTQTTFQSIGADGQTNYLENIAIGGHTVINMTRANGTNSSKTAIVANDELGAIGWNGYYDATHRNTDAAASHIAVAFNNWSSTDTSTDQFFKVCPSGSTTLTAAMKIGHDFSLQVGGNATVGDTSLSHNNIFGYASTHSVFTVYNIQTDTAAGSNIEVVGGLNNNGSVGVLGSVDYVSLYNTSPNQRVAQISAILNGTTANHYGADLRFSTMKNNGSLTLALTIDKNQTATFFQNAIGTTTTDAIVLSNTTASLSSGATTQISPNITFLGTGYNTTATASQNAAMHMYLAPTTGTTVGSNLTIQSSINGAAYSTIFSLGQNGVLTLNGGLGSLFGGTFTGAVPNISAVSTDGLYLKNTQASLVGNTAQWSPRIHQSGTVWNTTTSSSQTIDFISEIQPVTGATVSGNYVWSSQVNGGGYSVSASLTTSGIFSATSFSATGNNAIYSSGTFVSSNLAVTGTGAQQQSNAGLVSGAAATYIRVIIGNGGSTVSPAVNNSYINAVFGNNGGIILPASGTMGEAGQVYIRPLPTITNTSAIPLTTTYVLRIGAASSAGTSNYSAWFEGTIRYDVGSDATGDLHYRLSTGSLARIAIGSTGQVLSVSGGIPSWVSTANYLRLIGSGTGSATTISIAHSLTGVTAASIVVVSAINAVSGGFTYVTADATNINIVYSVAPASGTNNLSFNVYIKI